MCAYLPSSPSSGMLEVPHEAARQSLSAFLSPAFAFSSRQTLAKAYMCVPLEARAFSSFSEDLALPPPRCLLTSVANGMAFSLSLSSPSLFLVVAKIYSLPGLLNFLSDTNKTVPKLPSESCSKFLS